jgi:hypothetical protein
MLDSCNYAVVVAIMSPPSIVPGSTPPRRVPIAKVLKWRGVGTDE